MKVIINGHLILNKTYLVFACRVCILIFAFFFLNLVFYSPQRNPCVILKYVETITKLLSSLFFSTEHLLIMEMAPALSEETPKPPIQQTTVTGSQSGGDPCPDIKPGGATVL